METVVPPPVGAKAVGVRSGLLDSDVGQANLLFEVSLPHLRREASVKFVQVANVVEGVSQSRFGNWPLAPIVFRVGLAQ